MNRPGRIAQNALGIVAVHAGELDVALAHPEEGMRLSGPQQHSPGRSATTPPPTATTPGLIVAKDFLAMADDLGAGQRLV